MKSVRSLNRTIRSVEAGVEQVGLSRHALDTIIAEVEVASGQISDIAKAVEKQSLGIEDVNNAVRSIDSAAQTNAASLEEMTASSVALSDEAKALDAALGHFHGVAKSSQSNLDAKVISLDRKPASLPAKRSLNFAAGGSGRNE